MILLSPPRRGGMVREAQIIDGMAVIILAFRACTVMKGRAVGLLLSSRWRSVLRGYVAVPERKRPLMPAPPDRG